MSQNQTQEPTMAQEHDVIPIHEDELRELERCLTKVPNNIFGNNAELIKFHEFWVPKNVLKNIIWFKRSFQPQNTDLIIASLPKGGTTWLKSILFAIVNRTKYPTKQSPLLTNHPNELVYRLENGIYSESRTYIRPSSLERLPSPRLLSTHLPYTILPEPIKSSKCRVLFIDRNPLDTCVSQWHFYNKMGKNNETFGDYFEGFLQGKIIYGPYFEHLVEYWKLSLERPDKVLFVKYEELKENPSIELKRVAKFVGMPFSSEEESGGVIDEIIELCSINNLKNLGVNNKGVQYNVLGDIQSNDFFRKGIVGDWSNHCTPSMVEKMCNLMQEKFEGTSLTFKLLLSS